MTTLNPRRQPIELTRSLDALRRNGRLVLAAVVLAAIITSLIFLLEPRQYRATADVVVPVPAQQGSRIAAVGQSVSDLEGALRSLVVAQRVSNETGEPIGRVTDGLDSEQLFGGTLVEVSYATSDPEIAESVAELASREALVVLLTAQLAPFEQQRDVAAATAVRFQREYEAFLNRTGMLNPEQVFETQTKRIIELQDEIGQATATGDLELARQLRDQLQERKDRYTPLRVEYTFLQESRSRANAVLTEADAAFVAADAALDAAESGGSVQTSDAVAVPRAAQLFRRLLVVVVLVTALAIGAIVLLELTAGARPSGAARARGVGSQGLPASTGNGPAEGRSGGWRKASARSRRNARKAARGTSRMR
jgi:Chain length determinant protein